MPKLANDISEDVVNTDHLPPPNEELDFIPEDPQCKDTCDCQDSQSCQCPDVIPPNAEV